MKSEFVPKFTHYVLKLYLKCFGSRSQLHLKKKWSKIIQNSALQVQKAAGLWFICVNEESGYYPGLEMSLLAAVSP